MDASRTPAGAIRLASGGVDLELLPEHGARLHRLRVDGHDLLRTPPDVARHASDPFYWGAFVMAPWGNRLTTAATRVGRQTVKLAANFRDGTAIHGQVYDRPWQVEREGELSVEGGGDGWPWRYRVTLRVAVGERSLRIEQELENLSDEEMPGGLGIHPWFRHPLEVAVHAGRVQRTNAELVQTEPVSGKHDLRQPREMPTGLDATWTDARWEGEADPAAELRWPNLALAASMRVEARHVYVVAASPADVDAVAVEPQTHAAFGLDRLVAGVDGALALLTPGEQLLLITELEFESTAGEVHQ